MTDHDLELEVLAQDGRKSSPTDFQWQVYASATFAGLAVLIPLPFVDLIIEEYFRRRMPRDIAWANGRVLPPSIVGQLNQRRPSSWFTGCLLLPFRAMFYLLRDIFRTVLYALTVADSTENLGHYWHRAYLINYALMQGHLDQSALTPRAITAIDETMAGTLTSPLSQLGQQIVIDWRRHITRLGTFIRYVRRREETERVTEARETMSTAWRDYRGYLEQVADHYDANYAALEPSAFQG